MQSWLFSIITLVSSLTILQKSFWFADLQETFIIKKNIFTDQ